jgi:hypothetical protein
MCVYVCVYGFCNVWMCVYMWVCMCGVCMCGCFDNCVGVTVNVYLYLLCFCIVCTLLYCLYRVFVLFRLRIFILICFVDLCKDYCH